MVIHNEKLFIDLTVFKDIPKILEYFPSLKENHLLLFGKNKNIPLIKAKNISIYYYENYINYIIESLINVKKYDV